ncbi:MAG: glycosyltransferase family 2 protein [Bacteroidetes bacterium]|nr:glycosyltransferase family 2 protein [Bacteroidota bacterium]
MFLKFKAEYIKKKKASEQCIKNGECCVIIPTYNNSNTLKKVIEDVKAFTSHIIVVNDGSTDNTSEILKTIINIKVITHQKNKGKGGALRTGFAEALKSGFKYAITIDSDGQHLAKDIPLFYDVISNNPGSLIIGSRLLIQENMPGKNTFANKFSNFWFRLQTGINLKDTQSGFRLYPLLDIDKMKLFSAKYEYELEILVRAAWRNINIIAIPIDVYYPPKEERITHFRPLRDFTRISVLNTIFTFLAIIYYRPALFFKKIKNKTNKTK